jgi:hypothetical protein
MRRESSCTLRSNNDILINALSSQQTFGCEAHDEADGDTNRYDDGARVA